jgi:hypothetical protein
MRVKLYIDMVESNMVDLTEQEIATLSGSYQKSTLQDLVDKDKEFELRLQDQKHFK